MGGAAPSKPPVYPGTIRRAAAEAGCLQGGNCNYRPGGSICFASSASPFPSKLVNHPGSLVCVNSTCTGSIFHLGAREAGLGSAVGAAGRLCPSELFLAGTQVLQGILETLGSASGTPVLAAGPVCI